MTAILLLLIANLFIRILKYVLQRKAEIQKRMEKTPNIVIKLLTFLIYAIVILSIFSINHIDITPIMATLGIAGVAIGFAVKTPLENIISGLYLLIVRPISLGDYIDLGGSEGYVDNIQMTSTKIRTLRGSIILIPNTIIISSIISNHTILSKEKSVILNIKVAQNADLHHILKVSKEVADQIQNTVPECAPNFSPVVLFTDLEANALNILIVLKVQNVEVAGKVKHELLLAVLTRFRQEKIDIPPPMRRYDSGLPMEEKPV